MKARRKKPRRSLPPYYPGCRRCDIIMDRGSPGICVECELREAMEARAKTMKAAKAARDYEEKKRRRREQADISEG